MHFGSSTKPLQRRASDQGSLVITHSCHIDDGVEKSSWRLYEKPQRDNGLLRTVVSVMKTDSRGASIAFGCFVCF